jgi:hypothetical protein
MFNLPIPFKEKGALKTYLHSEGFEVDCDCVPIKVRVVGGDMGLSGATIDIDLSSIESRLDTIIADGTVRNDTLDDILIELQVQNASLTQTIITGTTAGSIPAGVQSYAIFNLGTDPNNPTSPVNPMIINGIFINERIISFSNSSDSVKPLANAITYDPNGNTLLIVYNS